MNQRDPHLPIPDVQRAEDTRQISINRVGIKSIRHPVRIRQADGLAQHTLAVFNMAVSLPAHLKGTHMSRFVEILQISPEPFSISVLTTLLKRMVERLEVNDGYLEMRFPYFIEKTAPVSGVRSLLDYEVIYKGALSAGKVSLTTTIVVPITSLCPCSKEISLYGAHNQRSHVTLTIRSKMPFSIEEMAHIVEKQASCELYGILKRSDEKYVTERAYDNPKFVEDLVRDIAMTLNEDGRIEAYSVEAENFESIHNHSAYAMIERGMHKNMREDMHEDQEGWA